MVATTTTTTTTKTTTMTALANRPAKRKLHARVPLSNQAIKLAFAAAVGRGEGPSTFLDSTREPRLVAVVVMATGSGSDLGGGRYLALAGAYTCFCIYARREETQLST